MCWQDLSGERQAWGDQLGPVPYTAIRLWGEDHGLDDDEFTLIQRALSYLHSQFSKQHAAERRLSGHAAAVSSIKERK